MLPPVPQHEIIQNMYTRSPAGSGLIASYLCNSASGTCLTDNSGNGNTATLSGSAAFVTNPANSIPNFYTYTWSGTNSPSASIAETQTTLANTTPGTYTYTDVAKLGNSYGCVSPAHAAVSVTVSNVVSAGTLTPGSIICTDGAPSPVSFSINPSGGTGTSYNIVWQNANMCTEPQDFSTVQTNNGVAPANLGTTTTPPGGTVFGTTPADTPESVSFILRAHNLSALKSDVAQGVHHFLSVAQFAQLYGQNPIHIDELEFYLALFGIQTQTDADDLDVMATGTAGQFDQALAVDQLEYHVPAAPGQRWHVGCPVPDGTWDRARPLGSQPSWPGKY